MATSKQQLRGVIPILPTPFRSDETVDDIALGKLVDFAISHGAAAVGTPAFGSEFYKLDGAERTKIVEAVIEKAAGRIPVIVQCNHILPKIAGQMAVEAEKMGATMINTALPRSFPVSDGQLVDYARTVSDCVSIPVIVQDWNPNGASVGAEFAVRLKKHCPHFFALKLEEPGIGPRIRAIREETGESVEIFAGWGGLHLLELRPSGLAGFMPGLSLIDVFAWIWNDVEDEDRAYELFARISPFIQFSLQTFEQFHHAEKRLLHARGVLDSAVVRTPTLILNPDADRYLELLIRQMMRFLKTEAKSK